MPAGDLLKNRLLRFLLALGAGLLAVALALGLVYREQAAAQLRTLVILGTVLEAPLLGDVARFATGEPRLEDRDVAGSPALVAYPSGEGPHPAFVFITGADPLGRENPTLRRLAEGLARAGYVVYAPEPAGLPLGEISAETVEASVDVIRAVANDEDTQGGRVGLAGVSVGASLALVAASEPGLRERVTVVAGVAPYTDIREAIRIGTTGTYLRDGELVRFEADPYLSLVVARSLFAGLPPQEGSEFVEALRPLDQSSPDPLAAFRACARAGAGLRELFEALPPETGGPLSLLRACSSEDLSPAARQVVRILGNTDPRRFDELYAGLPQETRARIEELSPITRAERIEAPVRLASPPRDKYFPVAESRALAARAPDAEVLVTAALAHADPEPGDVPGYLQLNGFVVEVLREAAG
ncbi:hypothetical protein [Rubrobacter taiwanensis]|uniref:hypothetical protein n=1 Tax=Rubrobacter taiwanensis TaxID=185139 RepID=UPI001404ADD0|nr:hypothetical protein [Rubrobacter taiwanensis]